MRHNKPLSSPSLLWALVLIVLTATVFWPVRSFGFLTYDDPAHIYRNPFVSTFSWNKIWFLWRLPFDDRLPADVVEPVSEYTQPYRAIYTPLSFTIYSALAEISRFPTPYRTEDKHITDIDPRVFHDFSLALHILNTLLVFAILRRLTQRDAGAGLGALLFAVHPLQVEPVAFISATNNLLSGFGVLLALWIYLPFLKSSSSAQSCFWRSKRYWLTTLCFVLGSLCKPSVVVFPFIVLALDWFMIKKPFRKRLAPLVLWCIIAAFTVWLNMSLSDSNDPSLFQTSWTQRFGLVGYALVFYLQKLFWPVQLMPDYGKRVVSLVKDPLLSIWWLIPFGLMIFTFWIQRKKTLTWARALFAGLAIFFVVAIPASGITPTYFHHYSLVADRYLYLSLMGVALFVAVGVNSILSVLRPGGMPKMALFALPLGVFCPLMIIAHGQVQHWRSSYNLWTYSWLLNSKSYSAAFNLGVTAQFAGNMDLAERQYNKALEIIPNDLASHLNLARIYLERKQLDKAQLVAGKAQKLFPESFAALQLMGVIYSGLNQPRKALPYYLTGLEQKPGDGKTLINIGLTLITLGFPGDAEGYLRRALKADYDVAKGQLYLGVALSQQNKLKEAVACWQQALALNPQLDVAHYNLGLYFKKIGRPKEAISHLEATNKINPRSSAAHFELGNVYASQGLYQKAKQHYELCLEIKPTFQPAKTALARLLTKKLTSAAPNR